jgi:predicted metalloendopeptidase
VEDGLKVLLSLILNQASAKFMQVGVSTFPRKTNLRYALGVGTFNRLRDANAEVIESILTGTYEDMALTLSNDEEKMADETNFGMAKHFFEACMNEDTIDRRGIQPLQDFISPLKEESILNALVRLELSGSSNPVFSAGVNPDEMNPSQNVLTLAQPGLGLPSKEYFEQDSYLSLYRKTMKTLSKAILPDLSEETIDKVVDFETQLAKISISL